MLVSLHKQYALAPDDKRPKVFQSRMSADEAAMLEASASDAGMTQSDLVRVLIRNDYAARGLKGPAGDVDTAWRAFEREHRWFLERVRQAEERKAPKRDTAALTACLERLEEIAGKERVSKLTKPYRKNVGYFQNRGEPPETRKALDNAFNDLWSFFDNWIDELKGSQEGK